MPNSIASFSATKACNAPRGTRRNFGILRWLELRRERKALADLDDYLLDDIGVTRNEALREARKPFWDAPSHWMRR